MVDKRNMFGNCRCGDGDCATLRPGTVGCFSKRRVTKAKIAGGGVDVS